MSQRWIQPVAAEVDADPAVLGGKGSGLVLMRRLGLPVPPAFVIGTAACRAFLRDGRFPDGLDEELAAAVTRLEADTGRRLGGPVRPLVVSVRSGGAVSMPGMMSTVLNLGLTTEATAALASETGDPRFAFDSRLRFLTSFGAAVAGLDADRLEAVAGGHGDRLDAAARAVEELIREKSASPVPDRAGEQLRAAVRAVFASWNTPRARTYRALHDIGHDAGTAVTVQAMVFGNRDGHSGTGVAYSRDPNTGERSPFGEVLIGRQGEDVVSGRSITDPLATLGEREPAVWARLTAALARLEGHYRDACYVEFTFESGRLWLLQVRPGRLVGRAAVRVAVDLVGEAVIDRGEALARVSPHHLRYTSTPRLAIGEGTDVLARGLGACPGVASGRVATTADRAARMAAAGPVILVRPYTSPADMHGLAAAAGVVTARGGPASHAAVVARSMGKPAVVGATALTVDEAGASVRVGGRTLAEGELVTIDGTGGEVVAGRAPVAAATTDASLHRLLAWADEVSGRTGGTDRERLEAARERVLGGR
ncbi:putative pyruvate phosphate dikinase [Actinoplanes missouriensis 431]|uniref:Putative pyruvate phosphate dikinase n=1 Tax=Actinoplanes missouriensis (strain ATCC 14538 / DSM 43046 / CBS 188.64 / JCM 3121 / NBRC 102363 / NCIMB 12654 / NRRL B-3342 / UNCC 431) TaxID=512565 RepID=I0H8K1_ACTM4|nr:putative pyruvate phosphate dikinase [Actinoplanes missouriensis 431]